MDKKSIAPESFAALSYLGQVASISDKAEPVPVVPALEPKNLEDTVSKLSGPGVALLRSKLSSQFGVRLESTGARASGAVSRIVMQTLDASPANPYVVTFNQHILTPFTGPGQFDLVERDSDDDIVYDVDGNEVSGGESRVTIATHSDGFTSGITADGGGWSHLEKAITSDKIYSVVFVPGTAGDGIYSINPRLLIPLDPDQTPLPS